ncbi:Uma2 family endonuclease [Leptolyngbya ohadii]|uniref:Uma2 family endonuclease n=1 Tax=Leptolyngbya ohadii TaxID=1962290 RepID=UPI000B59BA35|nr:Uma2 family endonuclease [Leptolyngbya ohadii]
MVQAIQAQISFDEFIDWYPLNSDRRYELHNGVITEMPKPTGKHSQIAGFIAIELGFEMRRLQLPYFVPKECVIKVNESGYESDVIVLNRETIANDPRWEKESTITLGASVKLVVEITSTNWSDDYALKLEDYEALGIEEYWICDYLGVGGRRYIGTPKQPTFSVYRLSSAGEYQVEQFRSDERIVSRIFPELQLTMNQIIASDR